MEKHVTLVLAGLALASLAPAKAGQALAPGEENGVLFPGELKSYFMTFHGGEAACVETEGDGDLDLFVYDLYGNPVDSDVVVDALPMCSWLPAGTSTYEVVLKNASDDLVTFYLAAN